MYGELTTKSSFSVWSEGQGIDDMEGFPSLKRLHYKLYWGSHI